MVDVERNPLKSRINISKIKQLQIKIVTRFRIVEHRNIFDVSKVSQTLEFEFSIIKIEFPMFVIEDLASIPHSWEKDLPSSPQIFDIEYRLGIIVIEQLQPISILSNLVNNP